MEQAIAGNVLSTALHVDAKAEGGKRGGGILKVTIT